MVPTPTISGRVRPVDDDLRDTRTALAWQPFQRTWVHFREPAGPELSAAEQGDVNIVRPPLAPVHQTELLFGPPKHLPRVIDAAGNSLSRDRRLVRCPRRPARLPRRYTGARGRYDDRSPRRGQPRVHAGTLRPRQRRTPGSGACLMTWPASRRRGPVAPYTEGDQVRLLHMCGHQTHLATVTVVSVKPHTSSTPHAPRWVVVVTACDNHPVTVVVDSRGRDTNGYIARPLARAS